MARFREFLGSSFSSLCGAVEGGLMDFKERLRRVLEPEVVKGAACIRASWTCAMCVEQIASRSPSKQQVLHTISQRVK